MPLFLAGLLVRGGAAAPELVEEALQRQVLFGGSLDTNLLELGAVDEETLAPYLARSSGLPLAPADAFSAVDARARRSFPARLAERHGLVPFHLEGRSLEVACCYPVDAPLLDEISFMLSLILRPHVAPEFRVRLAVEQLYGQTAALRFHELTRRFGPKPPSYAEGTQQQSYGLEKLEDYVEDALGPLPVRTPPRHAPSTEQEVRRATNEFAPARREEEIIVEPEPEQEPGWEEDQAPGIDLGGGGEEDVSYEEPEGGLSPIPLLDVAQPPAAFAPTGSLEAALAVSAFPAATAKAAAAAPTSPAPEARVARAASAIPERSSEAVDGPETAKDAARATPVTWTVDEALARLRSAADRDEAIEVVLRFGRRHFEYCAAFVVLGGNAVGWDALGPDRLARRRAQQVTLPLARPSVIKTVVETRGRYLGPVPDDAGHRELLAGLGRKSPRSALAHPLSIGDRVVAVLYADNGESRVSPDRVGQLMRVAQALAPALEGMIRSRKVAVSRARGAAASGPATAIAPVEPVAVRAELVPLALPDEAAPAVGSAARDGAGTTEPEPTSTGTERWNAAGARTTEAEPASEGTERWNAAGARATEPGPASEGTERWSAATAPAAGLAPTTGRWEAPRLEGEPAAVIRLTGSGGGASGPTSAAGLPATEPAGAPAPAARSEPAAASAAAVAAPAPPDADAEAKALLPRAATPAAFDLDRADEESRFEASFAAAPEGPLLDPPQAGASAQRAESRPAQDPAAVAPAAPASPAREAAPAPLPSPEPGPAAPAKEATTPAARPSPPAPRPASLPPPRAPGFAPPPVAALPAAPRHPPPPVRVDAARSAVERLLAARTAADRTAALDAVAAAGTRAAELLAAMLPGPGTPRRATGAGLDGAGALVAGLLRLGEVAIPALARAAEAPEADKRYWATRLLVATAAPAANAIVERRKADPDPDVAAAARGGG